MFTRLVCGLFNALLQVMTLELKEPENISLVIPDENTVEDRPRSPWTPSYSVISQGLGMSDARGGLCQEDLEQLEQLPERAIGIGGREPLSFIPTSLALIQTKDIDDASIASNVPEPPLSPQSDLGIFTSDFDTRSEVSAASREPASPTSTRTDLASSGIDEFAMPAAINTSFLSGSTVDVDDITPQPTPLAAFITVPDRVSDEFGIRKLTAVNQDTQGFVGDYNEPEISLEAIIPGEESPKSHKNKSGVLYNLLRCIF